MNKDRTAEALALSEEILQNIELNETSLENIVLKTVRLCRLLNDDRNIKTFLDLSTSVVETEANIESTNIEIAGLKGLMFTQIKSSYLQIVEARKKILHKIKITIFNYTTNIYYQLKYSSVPRDIFENIRKNTDASLAELIPEAVKKFVSVYSNIQSTNKEDLSNAVHSCRRILKAVADKLYPPNPNGMSEIKIDGKLIKVGPENYINRLMIYIQNKSDSQRFKEVVGSHLNYIGDRLDSLYSASTKGSHVEISSIEEAERYIIFTYLLIGDILRL